MKRAPSAEAEEALSNQVLVREDQASPFFTVS